MSIVRETPLPVHLPFMVGAARPSTNTVTRLPTALVICACAGLYMLLARSVSAQMPTVRPVQSVVDILLAWTPAILEGFVTNIFISLLSILFATALGTLIGIGTISELKAVRWFCWAFTHFFRNAPWLVVLFYCMLLLPFNIRIGQFSMVVPDWWKAVFGIAIAASANMAEVVRGAIQSIPTGQWESATSLAFSRRQTIWMIILPQCIRRMIPGWMNLYALVMVSTPLCSVVGVGEVMTTISDMLASYSRHDLLMPAYLYLLLLFFLFCFPIARVTQRLEHRFAILG